MALPSKVKQMVGRSTKPLTFEIEKGQVRRFAQAIGETNPVHLDESVAKKLGYPSLLAPPTFPAAIENTAELIEELGLNMNTTMHAEEEYEYFRPICAGDEVVVVHEVADAYDKQAPNGKLVFVVLETRGTDKRSRPVFKSRRVLVELKS